jgi:hypothetical protein
MIKSWFNERGYRITTSKGDSRFIYDLPSQIVDDAAALYMCRWMVFNQMMDTIKELSETVEDRDLALYTDSRLVEELCGDVTPSNDYAKSSLRYFIECDYVDFGRITFTKCAVSTINGKLSESVHQE